MMILPTSRGLRDFNAGLFLTSFGAQRTSTHPLLSEAPVQVIECVKVTGNLRMAKQPEHDRQVRGGQIDFHHWLAVNRERCPVCWSHVLVDRSAAFGDPAPPENG